MSILMPEKIICAILASGLTTIKAAPAIYLPNVFDTDVFGQSVITKWTTFLTANSIKIAQGFGIDENHLPGWYVISANVAPNEEFIGELVSDDDPTELATTGEVYEGSYSSYSMRVISASNNGDVSMAIEAIARYILFSSRQTLDDTYGFSEMGISATDLDPIYQYLPESLFYRSTVLNFRGLNSWSTSFPIIKSTELFAKFNPNEEFLEV